MKPNAVHHHTPAGLPVATRPFRACVAGPTTVCNPQAHGGTCLVYRCACGAYRVENATARASEFSAWRFGREEPSIAEA